MKRKLINTSLTVYQNTRSKKPKLHAPLKINKRKISWVAATKTYNYMVNDHIIDWLTRFSRKERTLSFDLSTNNDSFSEFLKKKGCEFEKKVVNEINKKIPVTKISEIYNLEGVDKTIENMKKGTPIIHSAPICNYNNKTYGVIDLLIRSDYINQLFNSAILKPEQTIIPATSFDHPFHYVVIDIKYSTLNLASNGINLTNSGKIPAYKSQLYIYNRAIGAIQGYLPICSYILGRRWSYTKQDIKFSGDSCFDKLGVIDFSDYDHQYISKTNKALKWYRNVQNNGMSWKLTPPTVSELYPNMCIDSGQWNIKKQHIAQSLHEITMVWNCGIKHRNNALAHGITKWSDPRCNSNVLGFSGKKAKIIDNILTINRSNDKLFIPEKITNNYKNWTKVSTNDLYIDFETFSDLCKTFDTMPRQPSFNIIYMIGVGYIQDNKWTYKSFVCKNPTEDEEYRIMNEFVEFIDNFINPKLYYWHAENQIWESSTNKQFNRVDEYEKYGIVTNWKFENWIDMCKVFKEEPIAIKGCFNYGLKHIAKSMKHHGMINTYLESETKNGMMAMVKAWNCYNLKNPINSPIMKDIIKYNEFDCKVIYDIVKYIRNNHV